MHPIIERRLNGSPKFFPGKPSERLVAATKLLRKVAVLDGDVHRNELFDKQEKNQKELKKTLKRLKRAILYR